MCTAGTLNVVCHGTIAYLVGNDGEVELLIPEVNSAWDHRFEAGTWAGDRLASLKAGEVYRLEGVTPGDGKQLFDPQVNICQKDPFAPQEPKKIRRLRLPPPKRIFSANYMPVTPAETFQNPADPRVKDLKRISTLNVLSYDCDNLEAVRLRNGADHEFEWLSEVVGEEPDKSVNLHVFAEPWTFRPLEAGHIPDETVPFNALLAGVGGDLNLAMRPPAGSAGGFPGIDPGNPIPGLPEPEKLSLSNHTQMARYGMLHNNVHPFDCAGHVSQPGRTAKPARHEKRGFAIPQNREPVVLEHPEAVIVYWGQAEVDKDVDSRVRQLLGLPFMKFALDEYGVHPPKYLTSVANPHGSKSVIEDSQRVLTTPQHSPVAGGLNQMILAGKIPNPRENPNLLYLIVAAPGARSETRGVSGSHNYFYLELPGGDQGCPPIPVRYAWALQNPIYGTKLSALDSLTWTLSHEFLEACTDPEPPKGFVFGGAEICDIASGLHGKVDGIEVTGYFSHKLGLYKMPAGRQSATQGA